MVAGSVTAAYAPIMAKRGHLQTRRSSAPIVGDRVTSEDLGTTVTIRALQGEVDVPVPAEPPVDDSSRFARMTTGGRFGRRRPPLMRSSEDGTYRVGDHLVTRGANLWMTAS
jgi:hypothetical protein